MINEGDKKINRLKFLIKLDRLAAWTLLTVIIVYGITGYGMTKGLISQEIARTLHFGWLGAIGIIAFIIHTSWAIHLALKRNRIWNIFSKTVLVIIYLAFVLFFGWVHFFYQSNIPVTNVSAEILNNVFTSSTLKDYNGLNGQPAYVAVDGLVYDLSSVFRNGKHEGHSAGQDLSASFHGEHPNSFLNKYSIVGSFK